METPVVTPVPDDVNITVTNTPTPVDDHNIVQPEPEPESTVTVTVTEHDIIPQDTTLTDDYNKQPNNAIISECTGITTVTLTPDPNTEQPVSVSPEEPSNDDKISSPAAVPLTPVAVDSLDDATVSTLSNTKPDDSIVTENTADDVPPEAKPLPESEPKEIEAPEYEEEELTMVDVLQRQQDLEADAEAVLGASDHRNCTYSQGYVKRQALYACLTCAPNAKTVNQTRAGVCLACSLACHENHDLIELYTKRYFRCDCGGPKFPGKPCSFNGVVSKTNLDNKYNQNFAGLYCTCHRPYPDPENDQDDEMIQCIVCEDWLHSKHLNANVPAAYSEMICQSCTTSNEFLSSYGSLMIVAETNGENSLVDVSMSENPDVSMSVENADTSLPAEVVQSSSNETAGAILKTNGDNSSVDVSVSENPDSSMSVENTDTPLPVEAVLSSNNETEKAILETNGEKKLVDIPVSENSDVSVSVEKADTSLPAKALQSANNETESATLGNNESELPKEIEQKTDEDYEPAGKKIKLDICKRPVSDGLITKTTFWPDEWRSKLCSCSKCTDLYSKNEVLFLLDTEDTFSAYELLGKNKTESTPSQYDIGLAALSSLGHVQQINAITEYNKMKEKLFEFLKTVKNRQEVVKEEDIKRFFAGMKPNREPDGVYFCH